MLTTTIAALRTAYLTRSSADALKERLSVGEDDPIAFDQLSEFGGWQLAHAALQSLPRETQRTMLHYVCDIIMSMGVLNAEQLKAINLTRDYADGAVPLFRAFAAWKGYAINPLELEFSEFGHTWLVAWKVFKAFDQRDAYAEAYLAHLLDYCSEEKRPDDSFGKLRNRIAEELARHKAKKESKA